MKILLFSAQLFCAALVACNDETRGTDQADTTDTDDDLQWDLLPDDSGDDATADTAGDVTVDTDDEPVEEPPTDLVVDTTEDMGRDIRWYSPDRTDRICCRGHVGTKTRS